jgi:CBS-domain-containing membrane protein
MHQPRGKPAVTGKAPEFQLTFEHVYLTEPEAARLLDGHRIQRGERVMDPKAQIVGEVIKQRILKKRRRSPRLWSGALSDEVR